MASPSSSMDAEPADELLGLEMWESELNELMSHVQRKKQDVVQFFQQLHEMLEVRLRNRLLELDEIVEGLRRELEVKRTSLLQLYKARDDQEKNLTDNSLADVRKKNLRNLEDRIGELIAETGNAMRWVEGEWDERGVEQTLSDICRIVPLNENPKCANYSRKVHPVWFSLGKLNWPQQMAIDNKTHEILVGECQGVDVFDFKGKYLHTVSGRELKQPLGIALTDGFLFASVEDKLLRINRPTGGAHKSCKTENRIWGLETDDEQLNIYGCEFKTQAIAVFNKDLELVRRVVLESPYLEKPHQIHSLKFHENEMYVICGGNPSPDFHLQIFSLEGELKRSLITQNEIKWSYYFCIDNMGNIIVTDWSGSQIKFFNNNGNTIHTINNDNLLDAEKLDGPLGVALDRYNRIIVAQHCDNELRDLQAF